MAVRGPAFRGCDFSSTMSMFEGGVVPCPCQVGPDILARTGAQAKFHATSSHLLDRPATGFCGGRPSRTDHLTRPATVAPASAGRRAAWMQYLQLRVTQRLHTTTVTESELKPATAFQDQSNRLQKQAAAYINRVPRFQNTTEQHAELDC